MLLGVYILATDASMTVPALVADFDFTRRYVIAHVLRDEGVDVLERGDAGEADEVLARHGCKLAFIAARLSGGDSFELCRKWTARGVRVVLVSSDFRGSELLRARAHEAGAVALLASTLDREQMTRLVRRLVSTSAALG
jgi:CheY-like chemotaxis protein